MDNDGGRGRACGVRVTIREREKENGVVAVFDSICSVCEKCVNFERMSVCSFYRVS